MDFSSLSDEELLKPDAAGGNVRPSDISTLSDEELLKPDAPNVAEMSDEELLKPDGDQPKPELGMFERMGLEKQAQTGKDASVLDFLPVVGGVRQAEQNRQEAMEQKLFSGEYRDTLEASRYALSLGIPQEEVRRINGLGDDAAIRKGFSDAVKDRFAARIRSREQAQRKLQGAKEAGTLEKIASGTITGGAMVAEFANPLTMAAGTAGKIINSVGGVGKDIYILDQKGKPVLAKDENGNDLRGDRSELAAAKAIAGGYAEQTIWTAMGIKQLGSIGVKLIDKIPGVNKLAAATVGKISGTAEKIIGEIASTEGGRIALKTGEVIGKVNDKLHFGSLPDMIYKTRLTELTQNVMGMGVREEDRQSFGQWLDDFTSVEGNAELLTGIIGIHLLTAGYGALKARGAERAFRHLDANGMEGGREEVVAEYIGAEKAKQLSDVDLDNIYRLVTSPDLTEAKINDFLDKMNSDQAEAQKKISAGESISSVIEGIREKMSAGSQGVRTAAERIKETLENKAKLTPEMEDALDGKIAEYTQDLGTSGGAVAKMVKDDILTNVKDNAVYEQPDMLDELVAMSMRKFNGEGRRLRIHDVRGEKNAGEQLKTINELGITSWEQAEAEGLVTRDKYGRLGGGARRALNIALHGTEKLQKAVKDGTISGELAEDLMTAAQCELGARPVEEQTALVDGILDRANGDEALARRMLEKLEAESGRESGRIDERLDQIAEEAKVDAIKERNGAADETARGAAVEPVETEDGQIKTVGEVVDAGSAAGQTSEPKPTTALGGAEQADRLAGTKLTVFNGTTMGCETFPEAKVNVSADGLTVRGLTADTMAKPENVADVAAFMTHLMRISKRNGIRIEFEDADAAKIAQALVTEISQQGAAKTMAKLETRGKLFGLLFKSTLGNGVTYDEASFKEALKDVNNGRQFVDNHGDVYGFVDGKGVLHFNPATFNMDTPIHEYGHLALEATKKINNALWKKGNDLIRSSRYYAELVEEAKNTESPYHGFSDELLCDEALARLIGDRGAKLIEEKGLDAQLKNWLKDVWKAFKGALGIADLTEEQIERMTVGDFVDTINAELLKGGEFGTKKRTPPTEKSIKRYDEDQASGSNGVLRWKNDRGYLFAIPVDMERTQPGGKVVFATDDANITDWIQNALNGYELRLSKSGKLYVKGRDGLPDELAEIFGRYPTIGQNDGIYGEFAATSGGVRYETPEALVDALRNDRANYDAWTQGRDAEAEHLAMEEARANAEAASRWEQSGMSVMDYIRSRVEEGDPEFDLDWETAREMEHDRAMGRFAFGGELAASRMGLNKQYDSAYRMLNRNYNPLYVWKKTGFWRGKDGRLRFEIPDGRMKDPEAILQALKNGNNTVDLGDVMEAPELYKAYPSLRNVRIHFDSAEVKNQGAHYSPFDDSIHVNYLGGLRKMGAYDSKRLDHFNRIISDPEYLERYIRNARMLDEDPGTPDEIKSKAKDKIAEIKANQDLNDKASAKITASDDVRSVLIHEIQHAIQQREHFAKGMNDNLARKYAKEILERDAPQDESFINWARENHERLIAAQAELKARHYMGYGSFELAQNSVWTKESMRRLERFTKDSSWQQFGDPWNTPRKSRSKKRQELRKTRIIEAIERMIDEEVVSKYPDFRNMTDAELKQEIKQAKKWKKENNEIVHNSEANRKLLRTLSTMTDYEIYLAFAGEVEARNAAKRSMMTDEDRQFEPPWTTEDTPRDKQIARFSVAKLPSGNSIAILDREQEISKINLNDPKSIHDYLTGKIGEKLLDNLVIGKEAPTEYVYSKDAKGNVRRLKKAKAKLATGLDEAAEVSGSATSEQAIHKDREGGVYYRRQFSFAVPTGGGNSYRAYTADMISYSEKGVEQFYDVVNIKDAPDLSTDLTDLSTRITVSGTSRIPAESGASSDGGTIPKSDADGNGGKFSVGRGTAEPDLAFDPSMIVYNPKLKAMGEMEQNAGGIAAAIEKKEALRPWTRKDSPCDLAKPIAMDCADMVQLFRAVSGSVKNPIIRKGEHIPGRPNAIGLNRGGTQIELANRIFGMVDASDVGKLKTDCASDGYFRHENPDWCAAQTKNAVKAEAERSQDELDRRTRELIRHRVATGEGGMHYATQVLGHEIGHTIATLPADRNLGAVGNAMRTLYDALQREMKRAADPLRVKKGEPNLAEEIDNLITWWHGADTLPDYYKKPKEKFAELFGIFLTQPESVHREAPKAYETIVQMMGKNERLALAYRRITEAKWSGKSNERVMADIERTWTKEQQEQFRELERLAREPISKARDWFNFALNDRFGPMFAISQRSLAAEKKHLARAVKEGAMSQQEANDRIKARQDEIDALKTALFDWQRQTGGSTRLMMADLDDVIRTAQRDGVNWNDVRMYAHLNRVIELGGRATAHGVDPSRAAAMLGDMARKLGAEKWSLVEKAWKAYRAVYERHALEDPNVAEMFDAETNKMLYANKHYVTMKHRMGAEETAEWLAKVEAYKKGNQDAWDPTIDLWNRMNRGLKGQSGINAGFKLYRLEGSFEATEDPIAATMKTAIDLKENAARNHLLKTMSQTLRDLGVKGVYDTALADGAKEHMVDPSVYERLTYMDGGVRHELIVPRVIGASFTTRRALPRAVDFIGGTMRFLRNTMTLWNPAFINRAYLIDKAALETNIKGLHKPAIDILSEALCFRGIGVPLYMANNYLTRFTPIANTWLGKILWNEHTVNHYAHRAQKIARMVYEGRFTDRLEDARKLRELGRTGEATEIEQNVAIAREMLKKNVFQSLYEFNVKQGGLNTAEILEKFGYQIEGGQNPKSWRGRMWERTKNGARIYNRFEEEQEAVTKIVAYLYRMKMDEQAGRTSAKDADARARLVIEQGGTPNLSARGVFASAIENATGFFWNVRKEGFLRTIDALKDHPTEWIAKNFAQTAMPALLKGLIATGCAELLIRKFFDDDEEKIKESWWAPAVLDHCRFVNSAMKCVPGYYQRNYNVIPIAKFGNEVLSMRVKYSPEEFAIQNAIHTAMQKFGADPTDPSADWSTLTQNMMTEFLPNIFGQNYALDAIGALVGPLVGINPYDQYRERKVYDENIFRARAKMPGRMAKEMVKSFWNYSPLGSFGGKLKDGLERKDVNDEIPGWLDGILSTPFVKMLPASMLTITSDDSYMKGLQEVDKEQRSAVMVAAQDILVDCIKRGSLGGFTEGLKDVPGDYRMLAVRHVLNGWKQWNMDPRMKQLKTIRNMKDVELKRRAWQMLKDGERFQD